MPTRLIRLISNLAVSVLASWILPTIRLLPPTSFSTETTGAGVSLLTATRGGGVIQECRAVGIDTIAVMAAKMRSRVSVSPCLTFADADD